MSVDNQREIREEAEEIFRRWKEEEFEIDSVRARNISYKVIRNKMNPNTGEVIREISNEKTVVLNHFQNALFDYRTMRGFANWSSAAYDLATAYESARMNGCIIAGPAIKRELQVREHRISELDLELKQTRDRLADMDRRFKECGDRIVELETQNQKLREQNPVFGIAQSSVDEVAEDASKKQDDEK